MAAVWSVELLSHTHNSYCQPRAVKALAAALISVSEAPKSFSSLKAGTMTEIFTRGQDSAWRADFKLTGAIFVVHFCGDDF